MTTRPLTSMAVWCVLVAFPVLAAGQHVQHAGAARKVMLGIDLSSTVCLDSLLSAPHLYALGPYEDLQGELTVYDGKAVLSKFAGKDGIESLVDSAARAPFLVYAYIPKWKTFEINARLQSLDDLERMVDSLMVAEGYDVEHPSPFLIDGLFEEVHFHIIQRDTTETSHSHEAHEKAKKHFKRQLDEALLVGFYSRHHEGVFTHKGSRIHVHWVGKNREHTGHLDGLSHDGKIILSLPARN